MRSSLKMDIEEFRKLLGPIFEGDIQAWEYHQELVKENPDTLLLLNIENIKSGHESSVKSAILFAREVSLLGKSLLSIQNLDLPQIFLDSLLQILMESKNTKIFIHISTCIFRLAKIYLPSGQMLDIFDKIFGNFENFSNPAKLALADCLALISKSNNIDTVQYFDNLSQIINHLIQIGTPESVKTGLFLLYSCVQTEEHYQYYQQLIDFTQILTPEVDFKILAGFWGFVESNPTFFGEQIFQIFQSLLQIIENGNDKLKCLSLEIIPCFIDAYSQEFYSEIPQLITNLSELLNYKMEEFTFQKTSDVYIPRDIAKSSIKQIAAAYPDDIELSNHIIEYFAQISETDDPNQIHMLLMLLESTYDSFLDCFQGYARSDFLPLIMTQFSNENDIIRFDAFNVFNIVLNSLSNDFNDDSPTDEEIFTAIIQVLSEESNEYCQQKEIQALQCFITIAKTITEQETDIILQFASQTMETYPYKILKIFSILAKKQKKTFYKFCSTIYEVIEPILSSSEEEVDQKLIYAALEVLCSLALCLTGDELEQIVEVIYNFITNVDVSKLTSKERDKINGAYGVLVQLVNTSQFVNNSFENLVENILTYASKDIDYKSTNMNEYEKDVFGSNDVLCSDEGIVKSYEDSDIQEVVESLQSVYTMLRKTYGISSIVDKVAQIVIKWLDDVITDNITIKAIKVASLIPRHAYYTKFTELQRVFEATRKGIISLYESLDISEFSKVCDYFRVVLSEFNRIVKPSRKTLEQIVKIIREITAKKQKQSEKTSTASSVYYSLKDLTIEFVYIIRTILSIHPELSEIAVPLSEIMYMPSQEGFAYYSVLIRESNYFDSDIQNLAQMALNLDNPDAFTKQSACVLLLSIIDSGKSNQEITEAAINAINKLVEFLSKNVSYSRNELVYALIKCYQNNPSEKIYVQWLNNLLPLKYYNNYSANDIAFIAFNMHSQQIVNDAVLDDKFKQLIKEVADKCPFVTSQEMLSSIESL
ncbi:hypothetical protein TVAG_217030 [Trichomonas vaginalis G3]|uniref:Importin N-terminal domain-containing protein n=1 Tax=Trichomonas vaginalis (strain ATCC PRA-98 / G3) TaxID=412133 RepID=A2F538_TRIV3|nr:armadillo (ARM) repeat-containing protein family [Trichomonas vaginalis G3]EAX99981.1 hypothetical protein TVAG_217030 [Trichomonas vaginalis G3]KAI5519793.1 armadillo (ARM) repeat-containing protein family [Trichomonas vaginalis G3]|eukprot:XP_001312911.1 hypothetical protein [Trichomonas vaginalis G3]